MFNMLYSLNDWFDHTLTAPWHLFQLTFAVDRHMEHFIVTTTGVLSEVAQINFPIVFSQPVKHITMDSELLKLEYIGMLMQLFCLRC